MAEFVCPRDHGPLRREHGRFTCTNCGAHYPIVRGLPVFVCDERSVFAQADYTEESACAPVMMRRGFAAKGIGIVKKIDNAVSDRLAGVRSSAKRPSLGDVIRETLQRRGTARVLVVGSGGRPYDTHNLPDARVTYTDVVFAPHLNAIVDAHDLPFPDGSFDLTIAVAVLEHVANPGRCVAEMWRVLAPNGIVFAVTPFLQPVHMGAYDFTRFTPLGHRRLFRWFTTIDEGVAMGAGSMLGFAFSGFLTSLWSNRAWRNASHLVGVLTAAALRKLDGRLTPLASLDNAAGCYFLGARSERPISDRELIGLYKGGFAKAQPSAPA